MKKTFLSFLNFFKCIFARMARTQHVQKKDKKKNFFSCLSKFQITKDTIGTTDNNVDVLYGAMLDCFGRCQKIDEMEELLKCMCLPPVFCK